MANKKYKLTDGNMWATDGIHDFGQNKTQRTINSEVNSALGGKAPTNHASTATTYGAASTSNYGHVKLSNTTPSMDGTAAVGDSTDVARANHVHPSDTSRVPTTRKINGMDLSQDRTLTSENIGYNSSTTYSSGTVGKAVSDLNGAITALQNAITSQPLTPVLNATSFTIVSHNVRYVNGFASGYIVLKCTANYTEDNAQYIKMPWTFGIYSAYAFQPCTITSGEWDRTAVRNGRVYCNAYTGGINFPSCNAGEYLSIYINLPVVLNS